MSRSISQVERIVPRRGDWKAALARSVTDPDELCRLLELPGAVARAARRAAGDFPLLVPRPYLARIRPGDAHDPLLKQVLPVEAELAAAPGFSPDPLGEASATTAAGSPCPGVLRKYDGRSLIVATGGCGVHCRFCFRRHFPRRDLGPGRWPAVAAHLGTDPSIREVILSGGDPLWLDDRTLGRLLDRLAGIPHVRRVRLHTRLPVVVPARVTEELIGHLTRGRPVSLVVLHVNHPAEIDEAVAAALARLAGVGIPLLSQSVLLRGVNDSLHVLAELFERLVDLRVMPYYLHQLDRVVGAAHFEVPVKQGVELVRRLRARLPGYAVPRYVREVPGEPNKVVLG